MGCVYFGGETYTQVRIFFEDFENKSFYLYTEMMWGIIVFKIIISSLTL